MAEVELKKGMKVRINCHVPGFAIAEEYPYAKGEGEIEEVKGANVAVVFPHDKRSYLFNKANIVVSK